MSSGFPTSAIDSFPLTTQRRHKSTRTVACAATAAALITAVGLPALAAPVTANVVVTESIALRNLTGSFTITGAPGTTATAAAPVTMNVLTNDPDGYSVTVQSTSDTLEPATNGNTDDIPIELLEINGGELAGYTAVPGPNDSPLEIADTTARSGANGDAISTNFRMAIPNVAADTYTTTLNVIATAL